MSDPFSSVVAKLHAAAEGLPGIELSSSYGTPALKVRKKLLCRVKDEDIWNMVNYMKSLSQKK